MQRTALEDLRAWLDRPRRKPLVIRGARQVGKTTLVRLFAERHFEGLVEINLERDPEVAELFASKKPATIVPLLELQSGQEIQPGRTLLFLDEIQAAPEVLASLRYFYEEMPQLAVVAAGSLLELALEQQSFSVPVGRIEYFHLGPMQFSEVLAAAGRLDLAEHLASLEVGDDVPGPLHDELLRWLRRYLVIGGMPDAVRAYAETGSFRESEVVKHSILATFRDDFGKYGPRVDHDRLRKVFERLPHLVGRKLKYVHVDPDERAKDLAAALHLLDLARVVHRIRRSAANGIPLGAEADERHFKPLFLDVGLLVTGTGLSMLDLERVDDVMLVHSGALCEQFVGQHLLYSTPPWEEPALFHWAREKRGAAAEVDYVIAQGQEIVPVEVKAGKTGTLKSMQVFLREKRRRLALRLSSARPSLLEATTSLPGEKVDFRLLSLPLYLVEHSRRLCAEVLAGSAPAPTLSS